MMITASHNSGEWNALKLFNGEGECLSKEEFADFSSIQTQEIHAAIHDGNAEALGAYASDTNAIEAHIEAILAHPWVRKDSIKKANFALGIDVVNSTGALALVPLLKRLGVRKVTMLYGDISGTFSHNPEPLPENLGVLRHTVQQKALDMGIAVDPDVDRLSIVGEDGSFFGEEYSLVSVADYVLSCQRGAVVSNLSSSMALRDVAQKYGVSHHRSAVGESHVVSLMKKVEAVVGGEGNGGVIVPSLHYGRDALMGVALFLSFLASQHVSVSTLRKRYGNYAMVKTKIVGKGKTHAKEWLERLEAKYKGHSCDTRDGLRVDFRQSWVHIRPSNTEPMVRIFAEAKNEKEALALVTQVKKACEKGAETEK